MELAVFSQSLLEGLRLRRSLPWVCLGFICFVFASYWDTFQPGQTRIAQYASVSSIFVFHILALMSAIISSSIHSQEVEQKTIVYLLTRPIPRWKLLLFRYLAC